MGYHLHLDLNTQRLINLSVCYRVTVQCTYQVHSMISSNFASTPYSWSLLLVEFGTQPRGPAYLYFDYSQIVCHLQQMLPLFINSCN